MRSKTIRNDILIPPSFSYFFFRQEEGSGPSQLPARKPFQKLRPRPVKEELPHPNLHQAGRVSSGPLLRGCKRARVVLECFVARGDAAAAELETSRKLGARAFFLVTDYGRPPGGRSPGRPVAWPTE